MSPHYGNINAKLHLLLTSGRCHIGGPSSGNNGLVPEAAPGEDSTAQEASTKTCTKQT